MPREARFFLTEAVRHGGGNRQDDRLARRGRRDECAEGGVRFGGRRQAAGGGSPRPAARRESPRPRRPSRSIAQRRDPDAIRRAFETGDYPYKSKVSEKAYIEHVLPLQAELLKAQNWVKSSGEKIVVLFEGRDAAGKGGTIKRFMEHLNPRGARIVALREADRARAHAMVFPALHRAPAGRRRDRVLRPLLVQPRRRRARDGLLHAQRIPRVHAPVPGTRADAGALGHPPVQILVLGDAARSSAAASRRARPIRSSNGSCRRSTRPRSTSGTTTPRPRRRCSSTPTPPTRRGRSSSPTTRSARGSTACSISSPPCPTTTRTTTSSLGPDPLIVGSSSLVIGGASRVLDAAIHPLSRRKG